MSGALTHRAQDDVALTTGRPAREAESQYPKLFCLLLGLLVLRRCHPAGLCTVWLPAGTTGSANNARTFAGMLQLCWHVIAAAHGTPKRSAAPAAVNVT